MLFEGWFTSGLGNFSRAHLIRQLRKHPAELYWKLRLVEMTQDHGANRRRLLLDCLVKLVEADLSLVAERGLPSALFFRWAWTDAQEVLAAVPRDWAGRSLLEAHFLAAIADRCTNRGAALTAARRAIDRVPTPRPATDSWAELVGDILARQDSVEFNRRFPALLEALQTGPFVGRTLASWLVEGALDAHAESELRKALVQVAPQNRDPAMEARLLEKDGMAALKRGDRPALRRGLEAMVELAGTDRFFPSKLIKRLIKQRIELELCARYLERAAVQDPFPTSSRALQRLAATARARA